MKPETKAERAVRMATARLLRAAADYHAIRGSYFGLEIAASEYGEAAWKLAAERRAAKRRAGR